MLSTRNLIRRGEPRRILNNNGPPEWLIEHPRRNPASYLLSKSPRLEHISNGLFGFSMCLSALGKRTLEREDVIIDCIITTQNANHQIMTSPLHLIDIYFQLSLCLAFAINAPHSPCPHNSQIYTASIRVSTVLSGKLQPTWGLALGCCSKDYQEKHFMDGQQHPREGFPFCPARFGSRPSLCDKFREHKILIILTTQWGKATSYFMSDSLLMQCRSVEGGGKSSDPVLSDVFSFKS